MFRLNNGVLFTIYLCPTFRHFTQLYGKFPNMDLVVVIDEEKPLVATISPPPCVCVCVCVHLCVCLYCRVLLAGMVNRMPMMECIATDYAESRSRK